MELTELILLQKKADFRGFCLPKIISLSGVVTGVSNYLINGEFATC